MTVIDIVQEFLNKRLPSTSDQICSGYNVSILFHCGSIEREASEAESEFCQTS